VNEEKKEKQKDEQKEEEKDTNNNQPCGANEPANTQSYFKLIKQI